MRRCSRVGVSGSLSFEFDEEDFRDEREDLWRSLCLALESSRSRSLSRSLSLCLSWPLSFFRRRDSESLANILALEQHQAGKYSRSVGVCVCLWAAEVCASLGAQSGYGWA